MVAEPLFPEVGRAAPGMLERLLDHPAGVIALRIAIILLALAIWQFMLGLVMPRVWISSPADVAGILVTWFVSGSIWPHLAATLTAMSAGYVLGSAAGIMAGIVMGLMPRTETVVRPYLTAAYSLPKVALAPLFVILFGIGLPSKIALVAVTVFFLLLYSTMDGVRDVDRDLLRTLRLMGASQRELVAKVVLPGSLPWIYSGLRIAVRYALTATVLGELISSNEGIGYLIEHSAGDFNAGGVFAAVTVLVAIGVTVTELLSRHEQASIRGEAP